MAIDAASERVETAPKDFRAICGSRRAVELDLAFVLRADVETFLKGHELKRELLPALGKGRELSSRSS